MAFAIVLILLMWQCGKKLLEKNHAFKNPPSKEYIKARILVVSVFREHFSEIKCLAEKCLAVNNPIKYKELCKTDGSNNLDRVQTDEKIECWVLGPEFNLIERLDYIY